MIPGLRVADRGVGNRKRLSGLVELVLGQRFSLAGIRYQFRHKRAMRFKFLHLQRIFEALLLGGLVRLERSLPSPISLGFLSLCFGHVQFDLFLTFGPLNRKLLKRINLQNVDLVLIDFEHRR